MNIVRGAIERDPVHTTVYRLTPNGWPDRIRDIPCIAHHSLGTRDELTTEDGVLLKGNRVCISPELHDRTIYNLHDSHQGVEKVTHLARTHVYWPRIDVDITDYVRHCTIYARHKAFQTIQPMLPRDWVPQQELDTGYFTHYSKDYPLIADPFSKYSFIYRVHSKTFDSLTQCLQDPFHIIPKRFTPTMGLLSPQISCLNSYPHKALLI